MRHALAVFFKRKLNIKSALNTQGRNCTRQQHPQIQMTMLAKASL
jgi:hypothetical protein